MKDYEKQAEDFAKKCGLAMTAKYKRFGKHFPDDKDNRDVYTITLERGGRKYSFDFGQSVANSDFFYCSRSATNLEMVRFTKGESTCKKKDECRQRAGSWNIVHNKGAEPTLYNVLACLTKYDPGTLEQFCDEFGYDPDSKKHTKLYEAVKEEYLRICGLLSPSETEELQEIQ